MSAARQKFTEFKDRGDAISDAELDDFWATLAPATIDGMIGEWKGGEFRTGHKMNGQLEKAGWFGKSFKSAGDVQPLVCVDAEGNKFSNKRWARRGKPVVGRLPRRSHRDDGLRRAAGARPLQEGRRRRGDGHHERQRRSG